MKTNTPDFFSLAFGLGSNLHNVINKSEYHPQQIQNSLDYVKHTIKLARVKPKQQEVQLLLDISFRLEALLTVLNMLCQSVKDEPDTPWAQSKIKKEFRRDFDQIVFEYGFDLLKIKNSDMTENKIEKLWPLIEKTKPQLIKHKMMIQQHREAVYFITQCSKVMIDIYLDKYQ